MKIKFIDITGMNYFKCPHCGLELAVEPRTKESLKHIKETAQFTEQRRKLQKGMPKDSGCVVHSRVLVCPSCDKFIFCVDKHSEIIGTPPKIVKGKEVKWMNLEKKIIMEEYLQWAIGQKGAPDIEVCLEKEKEIEDRDCLNCLSLEQCFEFLASKDAFAPRLGR